ncbi:protein starmaker isoform X2 [Nematostella vectensis]|nr:protein starmaker isoform X2 [Nematostella vectensis]
MASAAAVQATRITIYKNGDPFSKGKDIVINHRYYRTFDTFLDNATRYAKCSDAVRKIVTPQGRHHIKSVDDLQNGGKYVAIGREAFKKIEYGVSRSNYRASVKFPRMQRNLPHSGRARKVYEAEKFAIKRIKVYTNGKILNPPRKIILKRFMLTDMPTVLANVQDSNIECNFPINHLYTLDGKLVSEPSTIIDHGEYVAVERGSRFMHMDYGHTGVSPRNLLLKKSPRFSDPGDASFTHKSPNKVFKAPNRQKPPLTEDDEPPASKPLIDKRLISKQESFQNINLSVTPPNVGESPDITLPSINKISKEAKQTVFKNPKKPPKKVAPLGEIPRNIEDLEESEKSSIAQKLFEASGMRSEWGDMLVEDKAKPIHKVTKRNTEELNEAKQSSIAVKLYEASGKQSERGEMIKEDRTTRVERLIDDVPAEEVIDEEITETFEENSDILIQEQVRKTIESEKKKIERELKGKRVSLEHKKHTKENTASPKNEDEIDNHGGKKNSKEKKKAFENSSRSSSQSRKDSVNDGDGHATKDVTKNDGTEVAKGESEEEVSDEDEEEVENDDDSEKDEVSDDDAKDVTSPEEEPKSEAALSPRTEDENSSPVNSPSDADSPPEQDTDEEPSSEPEAHGQGEAGKAAKPTARDKISKRANKSNGSVNNSESYFS